MVWYADIVWNHSEAELEDELEKMLRGCQDIMLAG